MPPSILHPSPSSSCTTSTVNTNSKNGVGNIHNSSSRTVEQKVNKLQHRAVRPEATTASLNKSDMKRNSNLHDQERKIHISPINRNEGSIPKNNNNEPAKDLEQVGHSTFNGPLTSFHPNSAMQDPVSMGYGYNMTNPYWSNMSPYGYSAAPLGGMMGMGGNYGYGYGFGAGGGGGGGGILGPLSSINQFLFSFQSVIFSVGQAIQIVGMNTQQLHHLYEQIMGMFDHTLAIIHEVRTLEEQESKTLSPDQIKKRRRLKAIRWSIMFGITYAGYNVIVKWFQRRRDYQRRRLALLQQQQHGYGR